MPAASTYNLSVQVSDFEEICLLIQIACLVCDFCSSGKRFACGFLQIPLRDGHPCRPANGSPSLVRRRPSLPSECALPGAQKQKPARLTLAGFLIKSRRLPTLPRSFPRSTIGSSRLNFRVRDGNGCDPADKITGKLSNRIVTGKSHAQARVLVA